MWGHMRFYDVCEKWLISFANGVRENAWFVPHSQLKKYVPSETHVLQLETIQLDESLTYEEKLVKILDHKVQSTRNKDVKIVKILWV